MTTYTAFIYGLVDPVTRDIRYIGKSIRPKERLQNHMNEVSTCHRSHWLQSLKKRSLKPELVILEELTKSDRWQDCERKWIKYGNDSGWPLTNNTSGGDGVPDLPTETRKRISAVWIGRKHTKETRKKISESWKHRIVSDETKAKMSATHTGREIKWIEKIKESLRKLTEKDQRDIRRRLNIGETGISLAKEYGVHRTTISKVKMGTYKP